MAAHTKSPTIGGTPVKARPLANSRSATVSADQPSPSNRPRIGFESVSTHPPNLHSPTQIHADPLGANPESAVQLRAANTEAGLVRKHSFGRQLIIDVTDTEKRMRFHTPQVHSKRFQHLDAIGHQALAAGLVEWRPGPVEHDDLEASEARCDSGRQACRAAAGDHEISHCPSGVPPGPSPASTVPLHRRD